jgi:hypothetical protein
MRRSQKTVGGSGNAKKMATKTVTGSDQKGQNSHRPSSREDSDKENAERSRKKIQTRRRHALPGTLRRKNVEAHERKPRRSRNHGDGKTGSTHDKRRRTADGEMIDPTCRCCGEDHDTARHMMIDCPALSRPRNTTTKLANKIWGPEQRKLYKKMSSQEQYMTLLGKQMSIKMTVEQSKLLDKAVKVMLLDMNAIRKKGYGLQSLTGKIYTRPPEESAQMAEAWQRMEEEREDRDGKEGRGREEEIDEH